MRQKNRTMIALVLVILGVLLCAGCHGGEDAAPTETGFGGATGFTETTSPAQPETTSPTVVPIPTEPEETSPTVIPTQPEVTRPTVPPTQPETIPPTVPPTQPQGSTPNEHIPDPDEGEEHPLTQPEATDPTHGNEQEDSEAQTTEPETDIGDNGSIDPDQTEEI